MSKSKSQEKFDAAVELKLLNQKQLESIKLEQKKTKFSPLEIAIRKGYLTRKQLDLLGIITNPTSLVPGYRIDGYLGQGGSGTVYKATQLRMDRSVAIKTLNRIAAHNDLTPKRFEREAKIIGRLRHPNIISAFDFGIHNEQLYLVMEFADGIDADEFLAKQQRIPELQAWHIARQVCHALENAIQHGVTHRDIKPGNLILTTATAGNQLPANVPLVKVADFGLAKFSDKNLDATITLDQTVSGTPFYMSPEQVKAEKIDHRSDIYSLGTTTWHLIAGTPPITGSSPLDVITNKMKLEDDWLEKPPEDISSTSFELLKKMCRFDREHRIDDYPDLNREIESVIEQLETNTSVETAGFVLNDNPFSAAAKVTTIHELAKTLTGDENLKVDTTDREITSSDTIKLSSRRTQSQPLDTHAASHDWPISRWLPIAIGVIVLPIVAYLFWPTGQVSNKNLSPKNTTLGDRLVEFSGPPIFLFDGRNINPTQKFTGTWEPAEGAEGESILSGNGTRNFRCQDAEGNSLQNFRFVCGFRHHEAETIGFQLLDELGTEIWKVDIKPDEATLKKENEPMLLAGCSLQQFDQAKTFGYHQFRIEAQPDHWRIEIDDQVLAEIPKTKDQSTGQRTIQLSVGGSGAAHFEQIRFRSFKIK